MPEEWHEVEAGQAREYRAGAWLLLFVGVIGLGLGLYHVRNRVVGAFDRPASSFRTLDQIERDRIEAMKTKDTDADGISDFDETYVFRISPYLADSDSDGVSDKTELERGTNPNCPEGMDCGLVGGTDQIAASATATPSGTEDLTDVDQKYIEQLLNPTVEQVRTLLIQSGAKAEDLEGIDDETLMRMYREALEEARREREPRQ